MNAPLRPAERLAALSAIKAGLDQLIAEAKADTLEAADLAGARSFETPFGQVNVSHREASVVITDEAAFLAHVKATRPDEVVTTETVRPSYVKSVLSGLAYISAHGVVIDTTAGDIVEWAGLSEEGEPFTVWPKSARQVAAKDAATAAMRTAAAGAIESIRAEILP